MIQRILFSIGMLSFCCLLAAAQSTTPEHATPGAQAQQKPATPVQDARSRIVVRTDLVIVPVTVKDGHGQLVPDLEQDEFRIFEDDVEQKIILFDSNPFPLSAVILIDNNLATKQADQVQKSLVSISAGFGPNDEAALMTYEDFPETVSEFSSNNDDLFTKLKRLQLGSHSNAMTADPTTAGPLINGQPVPTGQGVPIHGSARPANNTALDDAIFAAGQ